MTNFEFAVYRTLESEGVLSDHPDDSGGLTKYGITSRDYPKLDIRGLTQERAVAIYQRDYWDKLDLDRISSRYIAAEIFDTAVNCGIRKAGEIAQQAVNLLGPDIVVDGLVGPATREALNNLARRYELPLVMALNFYQGMWYAYLQRANPDKYDAFIKGWMRRLVPSIEQLKGAA
jgi:lysozyme family protein